MLRDVGSQFCTTCHREIVVYVTQVKHKMKVCFRAHKRTNGNWCRIYAPDQSMAGVGSQ